MSARNSRGGKARRRAERDARRPHEAAIVRLSRDGEEEVTYAAVRAALAPEVAAAMGEGVSVEILSPGALPLVERNAPRMLADRPARTALFVGTAAGEEWVTWHAGPIGREPVPGSGAWRARRDQVEAARSETARRFAAAQAAPGARYRAVGGEDDCPPAVREMMRRFERGCLHGTRCPHKRPDRAEVTHQFGHDPAARLCDRCARMLLPYRPHRCNLCGAEDPPGGVTVVTAAAGHLLLHMGLCDQCYPEGADAPRADGEAGR